MSGGYFDRSTYAMHEIADTIERDIARALKPKPEKIQEDYWTIYEKDCFGSYHSYRTYMDFGCYDDAESFLLRDKTIVKVEQKYADRRFFDDGVIFQSTKRYMSDVPDDEQIPVLYSIHHCYYDHYPYNADVLELSNETIGAMKEAYRTAAGGQTEKNIPGYKVYDFKLPDALLNRDNICIRLRPVRLPAGVSSFMPLRLANISIKYNK